MVYIFKPLYFCFLLKGQIIMIITVICDVLGEENNGTTIACMNLIRHLKSSGHEVRVVCMDKDRAGQEGWYIVPEVDLGPLFNYIIHLNGVSIAKADEEILEAAIANCDAVHTELVFGLSGAAVRIAQKYNKPLTSSFHCQAENVTAHVFLKNCEFLNRTIYRNYYRRIFSRADCVHFPTQFIRDVFEGCTDKVNGTVISNGVNDRFKYKETEKPEALKDKFVILSVGRLSNEKNHKTLIDAVAKSAHKDDIQVIIAGDGPYKSKVQKQAEKLGVSLEINFYSRDELVNIINYSDLYVHPAEVEIEAIACLEAICCGLVPIIANSKKSATRYFAPGEDNLYDTFDSSELASKIDMWLDDPEKRKECSLLCRRNAGTYDQTSCMNRMEEMIVENCRRRERESCKDEAAPQGT